jgi:hypothetical protein
MTFLYLFLAYNPSPHHTFVTELEQQPPSYLPLYNKDSNVMAVGTAMPAPVDVGLNPDNKG